MGHVQFRTSDEEDIEIEAYAREGGDRSPGLHVRRVYFETIRARGGAAGDSGSYLVGDRLNDLLRITNTLRRDIHDLVGSHDDVTTMRLLAGLVILLYPSVAQHVQGQFDQYLDIKVIEKFLASQVSK